MSDQQILIDQFQKDPDIQILVTTGTVDGTGFIMNKMLQMVLMESETNSGLGQQMIARIYRYGNPNWTGVYAYKLVNNDCLAEKENRKRQLGNWKLADTVAQIMVRSVTTESEFIPQTGSNSRQNTNASSGPSNRMALMITDK